MLNTFNVLEVTDDRGIVNLLAFGSLKEAQDCYCKLAKENDIALRENPFDSASVSVCAGDYSLHLVPSKQTNEAFPASLLEDSQVHKSSRLGYVFLSLKNGCLDLKADRTWEWSRRP
jgi:hypothetical protein